METFSTRWARLCLTLARWWPGGGQVVARWWPGGAPGEPPEAVQLGVPHGLQPRRPGGRRAAEQGGGVAVVVLPQYHLRGEEERPLLLNILVFGFI